VDGGVLNPLPIAASVSAHADHIIAIDLNADVPMPIIEPVAGALQGATLLAEMDEDKNDWLNSIVHKASQWFTSEGELASGISSEVAEAVKEKAKANVSNLGKLEILYRVVEVMQSALSQYKIAGYPPDLLVRIPKSSGEMYEFHRTEELVVLGRNIAKQALDAFEQGHSSLYGQRLG
jgi:NTE family protein